MRTLPLAIWSVTGLFHGTRPARASTSCRRVGPSDSDPCDEETAGEPVEVTCTAATTTPATASTAAALAAAMVPRDRGRGNRMRVTTFTTSGTFPIVPCVHHAEHVS